MPSQKLENVFLYCVINLSANFRLFLTAESFPFHSYFVEARCVKFQKFLHGMLYLSDHLESQGVDHLVQNKISWDGRLNNLTGIF